jgi:uncharacterized phage-associated protein
MSTLTGTNGLAQAQQSPTTAFAVANWFLDTAESEGVDLTLAKLHKYVYLAYGWYFAYYENPLFEDPILATRSGPVVVSLQAMFRDCGRNSIKRRAEIFQDDTVEVLVFSVYSQGKNPNEVEQGILEILSSVWEVYSTLSYDRLANMMYRPDSPIGKIYGRLDANIPYMVISPKMIRDYFLKLYNDYKNTSENESD